MGMYTRLVLNVTIKGDAPIIPALQKMVLCVDDNPDPAITGRMCWMFGSSSYEHDNINSRLFEKDAHGDEWKLSVVCDLKNYEREIGRLADWLAPHVITEEVAGYSRHEEDEDGCELLFFRNGKAIWCRAELPAQRDERAQPYSWADIQVKLPHEVIPLTAYEVSEATAAPTVDWVGAAADAQAHAARLGATMTASAGQVERLRVSPLTEVPYSGFLIYLDSQGRDPDKPDEVTGISDPPCSVWYEHTGDGLGDIIATEHHNYEIGTGKPMPHTYRIRTP